MRFFENSGKKKVDHLRSKKDIKGLVELLGMKRGSDFLETRKQAAKALRYMDGLVVDYLIDGLQHTEVAIRCGSASVLGQIGDPAALEPLIILLDDIDERVRGISKTAIREIGGDSLVPALLNALPVSGKHGKDGILQLMEHLGDSRAVETLLAMLPDSTFDLKKRIIRSLGNIGDPRAIPALIEELGRHNCPELAAHALGRIGNPEAVDALVNALSEPDSVWDQFLKKLNVIVALGSIKDARAVDPLISLLGNSAGGFNPTPLLSDDPRDVEPLLSQFGTVGGAAADALGKIGNIRAVEPLIQALRSGGTDLRAQAARALSAIGDASAAEALAWVAKEDRDPRVRNTAASALVALRKK